MGKKSIPSSAKNSPKHDQKRQHLNSLVKTLRPKVYITDSSNFKSLVQELTGSTTIATNNVASYSPVSSPPPYPAPLDGAFGHVQMSCMDDVLQDHYHVHHHQEDPFGSSLDSLLFDAGFSSPLEGSSPDSGLPDSFNSEKIDFSSQCRDLESFLMGMDTVSSASYNYDASCYGSGMMMNVQQDVWGVSDYGLSSLI